MGMQFAMLRRGMTVMRPEGRESGVARMFFNFASSPPVIRPAEIFKWLFTSRPGFALTLTAAAAFLAAELYLAFFDFNLHLEQDEGEHLHVVYALERGEVPYRDFLENHPVLFNLILLWLKRLFGLTDVGHVYLLSRAFVFLHIIASIALFTGLLCGLCKREFGAARCGLVCIVILPLLGIWEMNNIWHVRPDWVALFYAYLAVTAHLVMLRKITDDQGYFGWLILGAAASGLGAAMLAKAAYVIVPYVMTLCLAALLAPRDGLEKFFRKWRRLFLMNSVFAALSLLFFAGFVALELRASGADLRDYIHANYALNSIKHPHAFNWNWTPFYALSRILDLPTAATYILILCGVPLFLTLHERKKYFLKCLVVFIGLTILFNASFPAWSNAALYDQYFIPSVAAAALYGALAVICLLHYAASGPPYFSSFRGRGEGLTVRQGFAALQLAAVFALLLYMAAASAWRMANTTAHLRQVMEERQRHAAGKTVFIPDLYLPSNLEYLTFRPEKKPAAAPVWGYFFFLMPHWELWANAHRLGFAPDPAVHWRALYEQSPPDAIAVTDLRMLKKEVNMINSRQGVDVGWLLERARRDYACITRGRPVYVRNDLAQAYLRQGGWRLCAQRD